MLDRYFSLLTTFSHTHFRMTHESLLPTAGDLDTYMYIGLNDTEVEGKYVWITGVPASYFAWSAGPSGTWEDCVLLDAGAGRMYKWNDTPCEGYWRGVVCEAK